MLIARKSSPTLTHRNYVALAGRHNDVYPLGLIEKFFVPQTTGNFFKGNIYLGVTLARNFTVKSQLK